MARGRTGIDDLAPELREAVRRHNEKTGAPASKAGVPEVEVAEKFRPAHQMNKTEARFEAWLSRNAVIRRPLETEALTPRSWRFESIKVRLATGCWYTPDFSILLDGPRTVMVDVKARWSGGKPGVTDDALVKIKVAGETYPEYDWAMAWPLKSGGWGWRWF